MLEKNMRHNCYWQRMELAGVLGEYWRPVHCNRRHTVLASGTVLHPAKHLWPQHVLPNLDLPNTIQLPLCIKHCHIIGTSESAIFLGKDANCIIDTYK